MHTTMSSRVAVRRKVPVLCCTWHVVTALFFRVFRGARAAGLAGLLALEGVLELEARGAPRAHDARHGGPDGRHAPGALGPPLVGDRLSER